jgi:hypothetical protein
VLSRRAYMKRGVAPRRNYGGLKAKPYRSLSKRAGIKAELDRLTSLIVRARDGRCVTCGTTDDLTCSHYFKRRFLATRFDLTNCNAQCSRCNDRHNQNPFPYRAYMVGLIGESGLDELFELRNSVWRPSDEELKTMRLQYQMMLKRSARVSRRY